MTSILLIEYEIARNSNFQQILTLLSMKPINQKHKPFLPRDCIDPSYLKMLQTEAKSVQYIRLKPKS